MDCFVASLLAMTIASGLADAQNDCGLGVWPGRILRQVPKPSSERAAPCLACHGEHGQSETENTPSLGAPAGALRADPALHVSREAAHLRADERDGEAAQRRRSAHIFRFHRQICRSRKPPADTGDPARMQRAPGAGAAESLQRLPQAGFLRQATTSRASPTSARIISPRRSRDYKDNSRHGYDGTMADVMGPVTPEQIADLAYYLARVR